MARLQSLELVREFLFGERGTGRALPPLDAGLHPNDALERCATIGGDPIPMPTDVVMARDGALLVSTENRVLRCTPGNPAERTALCDVDGMVRCLELDLDGSLLAGVDGVGLVRVGPSGEERVEVAEVSGHPLRSCTAIAVDGAAVYFTEGSSRHAGADWAWDLMERNSDGRLCRLDRATGRVEVLEDRLAFPAGVTLSHDGGSLLYTQAWTHSLWRRPLRGPGAAAQVAGNMVGYPGQIHHSAEGGYWLAFFAMRTHLVEFVLREDDYRREMMRTIPPDYWIRPVLRTVGSGLEPLQGGGIKKLGITKPWAPPRSYGLVACVDEDGEVRCSLHSRADGTRHGVLSAREHRGTLFIATYAGDHILTTAAADTGTP